LLKCRLALTCEYASDSPSIGAGCKYNCE